MLEKKMVYILDLIIIMISILFCGCNTLKSIKTSQEFSFYIEQYFWNEYYRKNNLPYSYPLSLKSDFFRYVSEEINKEIATSDYMIITEVNIDNGILNVYLLNNNKVNWNINCWDEDMKIIKSNFPLNLPNNESKEIFKIENKFLLGATSYYIYYFKQNKIYRYSLYTSLSVNKQLDKLQQVLSLALE